MTNNISSQEYWTEIADLARSVTAEVIANEEGQDGLHDALHETIDDCTCEDDEPKSAGNTDGV